MRMTGIHPLSSGGDIHEKLNKSKVYNRRNKKSNFFQGLLFYLWVALTIPQI